MTQPSVMPPPPVGLLELLLVFLRLGSLTFGGSVQSWIFREAVERRRWIDEPTFVAGLGMAMVLPGANPVNLAMYVGMRVRGGLGGAIAVLGMVLPAFGLILVLGVLYHDLARFPSVHYVLVGLAASGVGVTLYTALRVARSLPRDVLTVVIAAMVFIASGIMRWPMVPIVLVAVPISVARAYWIEHRRGRAD